MVELMIILWQIVRFFCNLAPGFDLCWRSYQSLAAEQEIRPKLLPCTRKVWVLLHASRPTFSLLGSIRHYSMHAMHVVSTRQSLHSAARDDLLVPRTQVKFRNRAFVVAGPEAWNSLPVDILSSDTVTAFKNSLKTYLLKLSYCIK